MPVRLHRRGRMVPVLHKSLPQGSEEIRAEIARILATSVAGNSIIASKTCFQLLHLAHRRRPPRWLTSQLPSIVELKH
jgi:hypothetical protein